MSNKDTISQQLHALFDFEMKQWEQEIAAPNLRDGAPSLARMYSAILREDWTSSEWSLIQNDPHVQQMYYNALASVWFPTLDQLRDYADGKLKSELKADIEHHLEVDQCRHSLRLLGWEELPKQGSISKQPIEFMAEVGFAAAVTAPTILIDDELIRLTYDSATSQFRLSSTTLPSGTLMQVVMLGPSGKPVWHRFVLLWDQFRNQIMGRCESPSSNDDLDAESRKHNTLVCLSVELRSLSENDAAALERSWIWSTEKDSRSIASWQKFAEQLKQQATNDSLIALSERMA